MEVKAVVCLFWITAVQRVSGYQVRLEHENEDVGAEPEVDFERLENEYTVGNVSREIEIYENTTTHEIPDLRTEKPQTEFDKVDEFKPSWHLGEIEEFQTPHKNPFNKPSHLKFDNTFSVQPKSENWNTLSLQRTNNDTSQFNKKNIIDKVNPTSNLFQTSIADENLYYRIQNNRPLVFPGTPLFHTENINQNAFQNNLQLPSPSLHKSEYPLNLSDKTYYETMYLPEIIQSYDHSGSFNEEGNYVTTFNDVPNFDYVKYPNFENYQEQNKVKDHSEIQEILPTRNQRFPYKFYHETPTFMGGNIEYLPDEHIYHNVVRQRQVSPWKKIIHLLGTILPFGLLLASLTPNIVQITNSTQSTIPLSKFKDVDLPPEHKSLRMIDSPVNCEEKNICGVILAGSKPGSNMFQNVLWNFVLRTPEKTAKDNGLRELFQAVKKRDCNLITC